MSSKRMAPFAFHLDFLKSALASGLRVTPRSVLCVWRIKVIAQYLFHHMGCWIPTALPSSSFLLYLLSVCPFFLPHPPPTIIHLPVPFPPLLLSIPISFYLGICILNIKPNFSGFSIFIVFTCTRFALFIPSLERNVYSYNRNPSLICGGRSIYISGPDAHVQNVTLQASHLIHLAYTRLRHIGTAPRFPPSSPAIQRIWV